MSEIGITGRSAQSMRSHRGRMAEQAGRAAEELVARYYASVGMQPLARRWRAREGELDLVVRGDGLLIFVEVKSGRHAPYALGHRQWARLEAAAVRYIVEHEMGDVPSRFDVALVSPDGAVDVVENARMI
jgi:putative endonuclease